MIKALIRFVRRKRAVITRWMIISLFLLIGPATILWFRMPGSNPSHPPIITVAHQLKVPLPLTLSVDGNFNTSAEIDLRPLRNANWQNLNIVFPPGTTQIGISQGRAILLRNSKYYQLKKYHEGPVQFNISRRNLDNLLRKNFKYNSYDCSMTFKLEGAIFNHSFSNKSLMLFYLSMPGSDSAKYRQVSIGLNTPLDLILNSSIPSPERVLPLGEQLNYDFEINAADSGLLFNFTDTSHAIFEEITLFVISSVFGFFSGLLIEQLLKKRLARRQG